MGLKVRIAGFQNGDGFMKKEYEKIQIEFILFKDNDIVKTSGEVDGDETLYPIPGGWEGA